VSLIPGYSVGNAVSDHCSSCSSFGVGIVAVKWLRSTFSHLAHHHRIQRSRYSRLWPQRIIRLCFLVGIRGSHESDGFRRVFRSRRLFRCRCCNAYFSDVVSRSPLLLPTWSRRPPVAFTLRRGVKEPCCYPDIRYRVVCGEPGKPGLA